MTELTPAQLYYLGCDLDPTLVAHRKQGGANLNYMEAWAIKATLIRVFGFGGFSADVIHSQVLRMQQDAPAYDWEGSQNNRSKKLRIDPATGLQVFNWSVTATATMRLTIHQTGATYTEVAASSQIGPDIGEVTDFALKTAESDALKRAAINLGTQFGLSLYNKGALFDVVRDVWSPGQLGLRNQYIQEQQQGVAQIAQQQADLGVAVQQSLVEDDPSAVRYDSVEQTMVEQKRAFDHGAPLKTFHRAQEAVQGMNMAARIQAGMHVDERGEVQ